MIHRSIISLLVLVIGTSTTTTLAFQSNRPSTKAPGVTRLQRTNNVLLKAGGFEWEDPTESFDQGVENPYKNTEITTDSEGKMKIDPARLLGPRLQGSNLYFIGMMGSGKSAVGEIVAKRESAISFVSELYSI